MPEIALFLQPREGKPELSVSGDKVSVIQDEQVPEICCTAPSLWPATPFHGTLQHVKRANLTPTLEERHPHTCLEPLSFTIASLPDVVQLALL